MAKDTELLIHVKVLDDATTKLEKISNAIKGSSFNQFGEKLNKIGNSLTAKITAPLAILAGLSLKAASGMEDMADSINLFVKSGTEAKKILNDIQKFASESILPISGIEAAASKLLRLGTKPKDLINNIKLLGEISVGSKVPLEELAQIYGKVMQQGKLKERALIFLSNKDIPILDIMSKKLNKTKVEILDMARKGQFSSSILTEAFKSMTSKGGLFHDQMKKNADDLDAIWAKTYNNITILFRTIGETIGVVIKDVGPKFIESFQVFNEWLKKMIKDHPDLTKFVLALSGLAAVLGPLAIGLSLIMKAVGVFAVLAKGLGLISVLSNPVTLIAAAIVALGIALDKLFPKLELFEKFKNMSKGFAEGVESGIRGIGNLVKNFMPSNLFSSKIPESNLPSALTNPLKTNPLPGMIPSLSSINMDTITGALSNKGQTDVNIKLTMPDWLNSSITNVRDRGNGANINFMNESYLGPSFNLPGVR